MHTSLPLGSSEWAVEYGRCCRSNLIVDENRHATRIPAVSCLLTKLPLCVSRQRCYRNTPRRSWVVLCRKGCFWPLCSTRSPASRQLRLFTRKQRLDGRVGHITSRSDCSNRLAVEGQALAATLGEQDHEGSGLATRGCGCRRTPPTWRRKCLASLPRR